MCINVVMVLLVSHSFVLQARGSVDGTGNRKQVTTKDKKMPLEGFSLPPFLVAAAMKLMKRQLVTWSNSPGPTTTFLSKRVKTASSSTTDRPGSSDLVQVRGT